MSDIASSALGCGCVESQVASHTPGESKLFPDRVLKVEGAVTIQAQSDVRVNLKKASSGGGRVRRSRNG